MSISAFSEPCSQWSVASSIPLHPFSDCYDYRPVGKDDLRLIYLFPPGRNDEIQCKMVHTRASEKPIYEALSYAWGDSGNRIPIQVDGRRVLVRENLWHALRALRPRPGSSARRLWVDALCINQGNRVESVREVQKMMPIYACAARVICWLGNDGYEVSAAVELVRAVKRSFDNRDLSDARPFRAISTSWDKLWLRCVIRHTQILFSDRPYWERVWIHQELICAAQIIIQCGHYTIPWEDAAQTCAAIDRLKEQPEAELGRRITFDFEHFRWIHASRSLFRSVKGPEWFLEQLVACRSAQATNPKDKIYSLCGLFGSSPDEDSQRLTPNYGFSLMDVCLQAFQYCVFDFTGKPRSDHCLDILCSSPLGPHDRSGFPSWLPDWSQDVDFAPISHKLRPGISASLGRNAEVIMQWDRGLLRCKGLRLGKIDRIGHCFRTELDSFAPPTTLLAAFRSWCDITAEILEPDEDWYRLISILWLGNDFSDNNEDYHDMNRVVEDILDYDYYHEPEDVLAPFPFYRISTLPWLRHRRLAVSDDSRLLLVPEEAREGDCICVIYGCSIPILLGEYDRGTYQVVGDCYVEGYMDGQAIRARNRRELRSTQFTLR